VSEPLLTAAELGEVLGLSSSTILDRFERGDLPGFRLFGKPDKRGRPSGPVRFRLSEIEARIDGWRVNGPGAGGEVSPAPTARRPEGVVLQASPARSGGEDHAC
jgi:predicted DNA-binding transcriptional regulator AlpA